LEPRVRLLGAEAAVLELDGEQFDGRDVSGDAPERAGESATWRGARPVEKHDESGRGREEKTPPHEPLLLREKSPATPGNPRDAGQWSRASQKGRIELGGFYRIRADAACPITQESCLRGCRIWSHLPAHATYSYYGYMRTSIITM
jgi:hypothetical protein